MEKDENILTLLVIESFTGPLDFNVNPVHCALETRGLGLDNKRASLHAHLTCNFAGRSYLQIIWPEQKATPRVQIKEGPDSDIIKADLLLWPNCQSQCKLS